MLIALLIAAQVVTEQAVATCRVPADPQQRSWSLERATPATWRVAFKARTLGERRIELPLADSQPSLSDASIAVSSASADGTWTLQWRIIDGSSTIDLHVSQERDPVLALMNTEGSLSVICDIVRQQAPLPVSADGVVMPPLDHDVVSPPIVESTARSEFLVTAGIAKSVNLFQSTSGRAYAVQTIGYSRELTGDLKLIGIPGRFAWGIEVMPVFAQFEPTNIYGVGVAPVVWRWNFPPQQQWSAFAELSMGGLWTTDKLPEDTSTINFSAHWGGGVRLFPHGSHAILLGYRFQHFSNGNQLGSNPGVNSHVFIAGWSHRS